MVYVVEMKGIAAAETREEYVGEDKRRVGE